ncbi:B-cell receptor CD22 isoform X2 [Bombina bombina]|uniref:B-cell receptor CD22 isoform X2 n=1 Tax=Bombina bombina TaxID=8345 RepID=UPI00235A9363|nr:B-cell receptor CD22 isoform X2 [Bombina bombina]
MMQNINIAKCCGEIFSFERIIFLFVLQGCFLDSVSSNCDGWSFSFQKSITALKGSCVEIPCTFDYPQSYGEFNLIWYSYAFSSFPQVFNKKYPSEVAPEYRDRTHLVGNRTNSCTLRINHVVKEDDYYPGINENINSWFCNNKEYVSVRLQETPDKPLLHVPENLTEGIPATISCSVKHTCPSNPPSLKWNMTGQGSERHEDLTGDWQVVSELSFVPSYKDNNIPLMCTTVYPTGQETYTVQTLQIKYSPKDTTIVIISEKIKEGDDVTMTCNSNGNPKVKNYIWYKVIDHIPDKLQEHNNKIILKNVSWEKESYYCSAINEVGEGSSTTINLPVQSENSKDEIALILGVTAGLIVVILLVLVSYIYLRWGLLKKSSSENKTKKSNTNNNNVQEEIPMDEHLYGNVEAGQDFSHTVDPGSNNVQDPENIYSNDDALYSKCMKKEEEISYVVIQHEQQNRVQHQLQQNEETEYILIKH